MFQLYAYLPVFYEKAMEINIYQKAWKIKNFYFIFILIKNEEEKITGPGNCA